MNYNESLKYIYSFIGNTKNKNTSYNLSRTQIILDALSYKQTFKAVHIAGTKGKGSTTMILSNMLSASDYKVGTFVSPHIISILERISINGKWITEKEFVCIVEKIKKVISNLSNKDMIPSFFELLSVIAFFHFYENNVDYACIEVGMGGRLDSTNIIKPTVAIITSISFDHMEQLGNTLKEITREKSAIIKEEVVCISAEQNDEVENIIINAAKEKNALLYIYQKDFSSEIINSTTNELVLTYKENDYEVCIMSSLIGSHQAENISLAIKAYRIITKNNEKYISQIKDRLKNIFIKARFSIVSKNPDIIVDGAHNAYSINCVLKDMIGWYKNIVMVFAPLKDKDINGMCESIKRYEKYITNIIITASTTEYKSSDSMKVYDEIKNYVSNAIHIEEFTEAIDYAISIAKTENKALLITGSLYTASSFFEQYNFNNEN